MSKCSLQLIFKKTSPQFPFETEFISDEMTACDENWIMAGRASSNQSDNKVNVYNLKNSTDFKAEMDRTTFEADDVDLTLSADFSEEATEEDVSPGHKIRKIFDGKKSPLSMQQTYDIKYLGCTPMEPIRSPKSTAEAIKTVFANSKAGGRKSKTHQRVRVKVNNKGIEILDAATNECLMQFSVYQISYCSVDASHNHAFSFVSSEKDSFTDLEKLSCHVFLCPKRKIAHEITLQVARSFENAYQQWRDKVIEEVKLQGLKGNQQRYCALGQRGANGQVSPSPYNNNNSPSPTNLKETSTKVSKPLEEIDQPPLIDLSVANAFEAEAYQAKTSSWVSFDEEPQNNSTRDIRSITAY